MEKKELKPKEERELKMELWRVKKQVGENLAKKMLKENFQNLSKEQQQ